MALASSLGISADGLAEAEGPRRLARVFPCTGSSVPVALTEPVLDALAAEYGTSVKLTFSTGELDEFTYHGSYSSSDLAAFVARAAQAPELQLTLEVNKQQLVDGLLGTGPQCQAVLFFTTRAVISALKEGLAALTKEIWPDPSRRLLLLLLGEEVSASGDWLSVLGGRYLDDAASEARRTPADPDWVLRSARRRDDYIGWDTQLTTGLAPWHFYVEGAADSSSLRGYVDGLFVLLSTLFTCDRARLVAARSGQPRVQAQFRGSDHVAFVPIAQGAPIGDVSAEERKAVRELLDWCYQTRAMTTRKATG
jgi:hypothetical protein